MMPEPAAALVERFSPGCLIKRAQEALLDHRDLFATHPKYRVLFEPYEAIAPDWLGRLERLAAQVLGEEVMPGT